METDRDLEDVVEELVDEVAQLRKENEELRDRIDDQEEKIEELQEEADRAGRVARASVAHARRLWETLEFVDEKHAQNVQGLHARISSVQEAAEEVEKGAIEEADAQLPIEQLAQMPEHMADRHLNNENHRNSYRARSVWKDLDEYAHKAPVGYVLESGELQRVLRALDEEGRTIESRTAQRVMDRIVEFTRGIAEKKQRNGEWCLIVPNDWKNQAEEIDVADDDVVTPVA